MLNKTEIYHIVAEALENALYWMGVGRWDRQTVLTGTAAIINSLYKLKKGINGNLLVDPDYFLKEYLITDDISYNADRKLLSDKSFMLAEKLLIWTPMEFEGEHKNNLWMGGGNGFSCFKNCSGSRNSLQTLLHRSRFRHHYELTIPGTIDDIQNKLAAGQPGIYPYFGKERKVKEKPFLCALIIKERDAFFYCKQTEQYYEFRKDRK